MDGRHAFLTHSSPTNLHSYTHIVTHSSDTITHSSGQPPRFITHSSDHSHNKLLKPLTLQVTLQKSYKMESPTLQLIPTLKNLTTKSLTLQLILNHPLFSSKQLCNKISNHSLFRSFPTIIQTTARLRDIN